MASPKTPDAIELALQHHRAGRLQEAEQLYRQILARQPDHIVALHYLGVIAHQMGRCDIAVDLMRRAIALNPNYAEAHNNLGNALKDSGQLDEAISSFQWVLALNPNSSGAEINLGVALQAKGQLDDAIAAYRRAIALQPALAEAHANLGNALKDKGQLDEAIAGYRQAIALKPGLPGAHYNLGNVLRDKGQVDEAIAVYHRAISLNPNFPEAHRDLGDVLTRRGQLDEAIAAYRRFIALKPNSPKVLNNLGNVLTGKRRLDEAIVAYQHAIALSPNLAEAHNNLGNALEEKGQLPEAVAAYQQAIVHRPNYPEAYYNLGIAQEACGHLDDAIAAFQEAIVLRPNYTEAHFNLGACLKRKGELDEAIGAYREAISLRPNDSEFYSNLLYAVYFHRAYDARAIAEEHRKWNQRHAEPLTPHIKPHLNQRDPDRRLRIGYVSPDFRAHPVGRFMLPLLENRDHQGFEVFAYDNAPAAVADDITQRVRRHTDTWRSIVDLSDEQVADLVRQDRIDILVDLTLHMAHNRMLLFARKPAPVQVTYLAYAGSSGLSTMDYRLSDPYLDPPGGDESIYSEQTLRLPETYWCYRPTVDLPLLPPPALRNGFVTFGCLNNFCKINEPLLSLWARILAAVPQSRLILHAHEGNHRQKLLAFLQREQDIDPARVSFAGKAPTAAYFELYQSIDIALDTAPYGGGTTTCDALWMGVPVVSLAGETAVGRGGLSILSNIGLPEWVANTPEEYVHRAVSLANDLPGLEELRSTLRQRMEGSPLTDAAKFARSVEAAYRKIWQTWCATA